ncbi:hypothetical protein [Streptomyces sp. NPDC021212]|uniref:hypothetical protein n=1 Tax=Streptomyces sp. NPDC021212 TaxID=3365118 RepID=UPI0037A4D679
MWWDILIAFGVGLLAAWLILLIALVLIRPKGALLTEEVRLLPNLVRLLRRLAADCNLPHGVRVRLSLLMGVIVLAIASIVVFGVLHLAPGDPGVLAAGPDASPETVAAVRGQFGLDASLPHQYLSWLGGILSACS